MHNLWENLDVSKKKKIKNADKKRKKELHSKTGNEPK